MKRPRLPWPVPLGLAAAGLATTARAAMSPFGVATPDSVSGLAGAGPFAGIVLWAMQIQSRFYTELTATLTDFNGHSGAAAWLIGLSFLYGIFHAVGPGHGKAVIASYLVATGDSRRRGVVLSFAAGLVQAVSAIAVVSILAVVFDATAMRMTRATDAVALASYALVMLLGLTMVAVKGRSAWRTIRPARRAPATRFACIGLPAGAIAMSDIDHDRTEAIHGVDCACVAAARLATGGARRSWPQMAAAVGAIGVRPCSGALIVLVFALSQHLYTAGVLSVLAMAAGTGMTVALVAILSTLARDWLARVAGNGNRLLAGFGALAQLAAALLIVLFGATMFTGALALGGA